MSNELNSSDEEKALRALGEPPNYDMSSSSNEEIDWAEVGRGWKIKCKSRECKKTFSDANGARRHYFLKHEKKKYRCCVLCESSFMRNLSLISHYKDVHEEDVKKRPIVCRICKETFNRFNECQRHFDSTHSKPFKCHRCDTCYTRAEKRNRHEMKKHGLPKNWRRNNESPPPL